MTWPNKVGNVQAVWDAFVFPLSHCQMHKSGFPFSKAESWPFLPGMLSLQVRNTLGFFLYSSWDILELERFWHLLESTGQSWLMYIPEDWGKIVLLTEYTIKGKITGNRKKKKLNLGQLIMQSIGLCPRHWIGVVAISKKIICAWRKYIPFLPVCLLKLGSLGVTSLYQQHYFKLVSIHKLSLMQSPRENLKACLTRGEPAAKRLAWENGSN